jgi:uncharacterized protein (TIGR03118 family)
MKRILASCLFLHPVGALNRVTIGLLLTLSPQLLSAGTGYLVHNLVADDKSTATADFYDPRLINVWGVAPTGAFWVCVVGKSTVYGLSPTNATPIGTPNATLQPTIPGAGGSKGTCTGIVGNTAPATTPPTFPVTAPGKNPVAAGFLFVSEDGVLSAWAGGADITQAFVEVDNSSKAVYKGLALLTPPAGATTPPVQLYAANFKTGTIDVFDAQFKPVTLASGAFVDTKIPAGFAPFNIQAISGNLYVTYAKQDANKFFDVPGPGNGYVDVFDSTGKLLQSFFGGPGSPLNSPWGVAIAPATFGRFANDLLVGNFGDGTINAFDPTTGAFLGPLQDGSGTSGLFGTPGKTITIPGLWALTFGRGGGLGDIDTLYFTAGPGGQRHGLLGSISANPNITATGVTNAAQAAGGIAANTYITIKGNNLAPTKRSWATADFGATGKTLPTTLDGVTVTVNGEAAYIIYISPVQINVLTPTDLPPGGDISVQVSDSTLTSSTVTVSAQAVAPSFFLADVAGHVAAVHLNFSRVGTASPPAGTPAAPGEVIVLYGNGFGATSPAAVNGQVLAGPAPMVVNPIITFNGISGNVVFAGLVATGVYEINVRVPTGLPDGDARVSATAGGVTSPTGALIAIKN